MDRRAVLMSPAASSLAEDRAALTAPVSPMCVRRNEGAIGKTVTLAGPKAYTVDEVIELCEKYAGADADVTQVRFSV